MCGLFVAVAACGAKPAPLPEAPPSNVSAESPLPRPALAGAFPARPLLIPTRREDVAENYFGRTVHDPYRWLENGDSEEVKHWTDEQNAVTRRVLDRVRDRDRLHARLSDLLGIGTVGTPAVRKIGPDKNRYFHVRREGQQNQPILYVRDGVRGSDQILIDPNSMSSDGTTSLDWWSPSNDGRLLAYGISQNGDEDSTLFILDIEKKKDLPDKIERTKYASIAWLPDGKSFYYTRYPKKGTVPEGEENYHRTVYLHRIGDEPDKDTYVFGKDRKMTDSPSVEISPDGRWLLVSVYEGWVKNELFLKDLRDKKQVTFTPVVTGVEAIFDATLRNDIVYVRTNDGAARYALYTFDPKKPERAGWKQIIAEKQDVLSDVAPIGADLVATYLSDASSKVRVFSKSGEAKGDIALPTVGSTAGAAGRWDGDEAFYDFSSFAVAPTIYRFDLKSAKSEKWDAVEAPIDPGAFDVERIRATSKDGTKVPIFLIHKKGSKETARRPRCSPATADSTSASCRPSRPRCTSCSSAAASSPSPTCAAAVSSEKPGTRPACSVTSKTCSTTPSPLPASSSPAGTPIPRISPCSVDRTAGFWWARSSRKDRTCFAPRCAAFPCSTCSATSAFASPSSGLPNTARRRIRSNSSGSTNTRPTTR